MKKQVLVDNAPYVLPRSWSMWVFLAMVIVPQAWDMLPKEAIEAMPKWLPAALVSLGGIIGMIVRSLKQYGVIQDPVEDEEDHLGVGS